MDGRPLMAHPDDLPRHGDPTEIEPRPETPPMRGPGATTAQLKADIDSGATGDKVAVFDPGAAPLGTGAEAAGTPMTPEMIQLDREMQRMQNAPHGDPGRRMGIGKGGVVAGTLAVLVAIGVALALFAP
jgi:hypothetical protein